MGASAELAVKKLKAGVPPWLARRLGDFARLMRLHQPVGIWLLLWPTLWALWSAAQGHPGVALVAIFVLGTVLMRSAGCVINDLSDRNIDTRVRRTRLRPLAARRVAPSEAVALAVALLAAALWLGVHLNGASVRLAILGAGLTVSYPLMKRFFPLPQMYLGLAFGWGVPMACAAVQGSVPRYGWLMFIAAVLWAGIYDTFYAMADREDDLKIGVRSSAILFEELDLAIIAALQLAMLLTLHLVGRQLHYGWRYELGLGAGALSFLWQQWVARDRLPEHCLRAFRHNQYFGLLVFCGLWWQLHGA